MEMTLNFDNYKMIYKILKSFVGEHGNEVEVDLTDFTYIERGLDVDDEPAYEACDKWVKTDEYYCTICLNENSETPITVHLFDGIFGFDQLYEIPFWAVIRIKNECLELEWKNKQTDRWIRFAIKDKQLDRHEVQVDIKNNEPA